MRKYRIFGNFVHLDTWDDEDGQYFLGHVKEYDGVSPSSGTIRNAFKVVGGDGRVSYYVTARNFLDRGLWVKIDDSSILTDS